MTRKTKIIATVGPSIHSKEAINEIIDAGANVLRLNFSHGSNDEYKQIVDWARSSNKKIAIMQDIQGPKIRTGHLEQSFDLSQGAEIEIFNEDSKKNNENIVINYDQLFEDVSEGERILIDDGKLSLRVTKKEKGVRNDSKKWQQGKFVHPHDACFDSVGNIFVAEWVSTGRITRLKKLN